MWRKEIEDIRQGLWMITRLRLLVCSLSASQALCAGEGRHVMLVKKSADFFLQSQGSVSRVVAQREMLLHPRTLYRVSITSSSA